jgi:hypothetical protein
MSDVISEYQKWKQQGDDLRIKAKQAMESRFRELLVEAARIAEEYRLDFGSTLKPPPTVTVFRFRVHTKTKSKKPAKQKVLPEVQGTPPLALGKANPKVVEIQKRLTTAKRRLEGAKAAGTATRNLEDKIYEIEDELRLATQPR